MAEIDKRTLASVAEVSRLKLSEEEALELQNDLESILSHFRSISEIKEGQELYYVREMREEERPDHVSKTPPDDFVKGFNRKKERYLMAPKALE